MLQINILIRTNRFLEKHTADHCCKNVYSIYLCTTLLIFLLPTTLALCYPRTVFILSREITIAVVLIIDMLFWPLYFLYINC